MEIENFKIKKERRIKMDNKHLLKIYCPTLGKEGVINPDKLEKTCPFCGCVIAPKNEFYTCNIQVLRANA